MVVSLARNPSVGVNDIEAGGIGVGVGVGSTVAAGVATGTRVAAGIGVGVGVAVATGTRVAVGMGSTVAVGLGISVGGNSVSGGTSVTGGMRVEPGLGVGTSDFVAAGAGEGASTVMDANTGVAVEIGVVVGSGTGGSTGAAVGVEIGNEVKEGDGAGVCVVGTCKMAVGGELVAWPMSSPQAAMISKYINDRAPRDTSLAKFTDAIRVLRQRISN